MLGGHVFAAPKPAAGLHLVATPIGNLGDITLRALETLAGVDVIACEDTRITRRLTERYGIAAELTPYHEHNAAAARPKILQRLAKDGSVALVSDAGTPLVSDPGFKLVREACASGYSVLALPGASSVLTALAVAGLPTDRFYFEGFLPPKSAARRARLSELARIDATLVVFESGNRLPETLTDLAGIMGAREAAICRELTKLHEEIRRATLSQLAQEADQIETRGEFVLVIGPPPSNADVLTAEALDALLREALLHHSLKDAVTHAVELSGHPRRDVYARALQIARQVSPKGSHDEE
jgi:16S rRNA (cytidine1402-2'-O)-methyltransferase